MIFDNWADVCLAKKKNVGVTQLAASLWGQPIWMLHLNCTQGFYNVRNGLSFITSKGLSKNFSNENKHTLCFQIICILIQVLSRRQQKHQCLSSLLRFFGELFDVINDIHFWHCKKLPLIMWNHKIQNWWKQCD